MTGDAQHPEAAVERFRVAFDARDAALHCVAQRQLAGRQCEERVHLDLDDGFSGRSWLRLNERT